jgi:hypothetical protein
LVGVELLVVVFGIGFFPFLEEKLKGDCGK